MCFWRKQPKVFKQKKTKYGKKNVCLATIRLYDKKANTFDVKIPGQLNYYYKETIESPYDLLTVEILDAGKIAADYLKNIKYHDTPKFYQDHLDRPRIAILFAPVQAEIISKEDHWVSYREEYYD